MPRPGSRGVFMSYGIFKDGVFLFLQVFTLDQPAVVIHIFRLLGRRFLLFLIVFALIPEAERLPR